MTFDEMYASSRAYGRHHRTLELIARRIFENPTDTIQVSCATEDEAAKLFWDLKILYGFDLKNLHFEFPKEKDADRKS